MFSELIKRILPPSKPTEKPSQCFHEKRIGHPGTLSSLGGKKGNHFFIHEHCFLQNSFGKVAARGGQLPLVSAGAALATPGTASSVSSKLQAKTKFSVFQGRIT